MKMFHRSLFGLACLFVATPSASAAWVTIRNDTDKVVVVQEARLVNGRLIKGKEYKLAPGEVLKEFQAAAGEKTVLLSGTDIPQDPAKVKVAWGNANAAFAVTKDGTAFKLGPAKAK